MWHARSLSFRRARSRCWWIGSRLVLSGTTGAESRRGDGCGVHAEALSDHTYVSPAIPVRAAGRFCPGPRLVLWPVCDQGSIGASYRGRGQGFAEDLPDTGRDQEPETALMPARDPVSGEDMQKLWRCRVATLYAGAVRADPATQRSRTSRVEAVTRHGAGCSRCAVVRGRMAPDVQCRS